MEKLTPCFHWFLHIARVNLVFRSLYEDEASDGDGGDDTRECQPDTDCCEDGRCIVKRNILSDDSETNDMEYANLPLV